MLTSSSQVNFLSSFPPNIGGYLSIKDVEADKAASGDQKIEEKKVPCLLFYYGMTRKSSYYPNSSESNIGSMGHYPAILRLKNEAFCMYASLLKKKKPIELTFTQNNIRESAEKAVTINFKGNAQTICFSATTSSEFFTDVDSKYALEYPVYFIFEYTSVKFEFSAEGGKNAFESDLLTAGKSDDAKPSEV